MPDRTDTSPAQNGAAITPNDAPVASAQIYRAIYVGVSGDVTLRSDPYSSSVTYKAVPVGILPVNCQWVYSTGTTATNLVGLM